MKNYTPLVVLAAALLAGGCSGPSLASASPQPTASPVPTASPALSFEKALVRLENLAKSIYQTKQSELGEFNLTSYKLKNDAVQMVGVFGDILSNSGKVFFDECVWQYTGGKWTLTSSQSWYVDNSTGKDTDADYEICPAFNPND
jgi:hypothetical protein